jgi:pimeloyl-ACP methyl ester carboxylesterase
MRRSLLRTGLSLLAGGVLVLVVGPLLIPIPPLKGIVNTHELADEDSEFVQINGLEVHLKRAGQGERVFLLLHGFGASLYSWHSVMEPLSQLGRVMAYDRPGFGLTEHPLYWQGQNPYSDDTQVELVKGLLDHYGIDKAILVGSSAGGRIAMQAALAHPERISALILVDPAVYSGMGAPSWLHYLLASPQMRRMGPLLTRLLLRRGPELLDLAWHDPQRIPVEMVDYYRKPFKVENWDKALWEFTIASKPSRLADQLVMLQLPVLVITGDDDRIVPTAESIRLASEVPNASLDVIAEAGHLPHEEQPDRFMQSISGFVGKLHT